MQKHDEKIFDWLNSIVLVFCVGERYLYYYICVDQIMSNPQKLDHFAWLNDVKYTFSLAQSPSFRRSAHFLELASPISPRSAEAAWAPWGSPSLATPSLVWALFNFIRS